VNKALGYVAVAVILGLSLILVPTYLFLVKAGDQGFFSGQGSLAARLPLIGQSEYSDHVEKVSATDLEVLGVSFVIASVVYILFKRKTPRHDYMWPLSRSC
jgi:hypothetical protein